jgi:hypothetical protein
MTITLYKNESEKNKINKILTSVASVTGVLRDGSSIISPEIVIEYNDPTGFNYCHIDSFNRYYFVNNIVVLSNKLIKLSLKVDVLESFKTSILSQNIIVDKSTNKVNNYLHDENLIVNVKTKTDIVNFPSGLLDNGEFILITAGGVPTI